MEAAISVVTHALINSGRQKKGLGSDSAPRWACVSGRRSSGLDVRLAVYIRNIQNAWITRRDTVLAPPPPIFQQGPLCCGGGPG